jgi:hypothetical protein
LITSLNEFVVSAADANQTTDVTQQGSMSPGQHSAPSQSLAASKASISYAVTRFENDVRGIRRPSRLASSSAASSDPAAEIAKLEQADLEAAAHDQIAFSRTPHSKLMQALDMHLSKPLQLSDSLLAACKLPLELKQADALCAAIQEHTAPAVALLASIDQLAGYLKSRPTMKLVDETSSQLIAQLDQLWTLDMQTAAKAAHALYTQFDDHCNHLLLGLSKLAANGMCLTATSTTSLAETAAAQKRITAYSAVLELLRKNFSSNAETQLHRSEVVRLRPILHFVTQHKQKGFAQLLEAKKLLALPELDEQSLAVDSSRALASVQSQQHGMIIITDADGIPALISSSTTVDFGTVLSSSGRTDRAIRLVNHTCSTIHAKVMVHHICIGAPCRVESCQNAE